MQAKVEGNLVPATQVVPRVHKFGQVADGQRLVSCTLSIPMGDISKFEQFYTDYAADDADYGEDDELPVVLELRRLGWPPLPKLLQSNPGLFEQFSKHVAYDLLLSVVPAGSAPRYFINEVEEIKIQGTSLVLTTRAIDIGNT